MHYFQQNDPQGHIKALQKGVHGNLLLPMDPQCTQRVTGADHLHDSLNDETDGQGEQQTSGTGSHSGAEVIAAAADMGA